jgi:hypothetical protein
MYLAQQILRIQRVEVAPDGHLGHVEFGGQVGYPDRTAGVQRPQDRVAAFGGEHENAQYQTNFVNLFRLDGAMLLVSGCF